MFLLLLLAFYFGGVVCMACGGLVSVRDNGEEITPEEAMIVCLFWPMVIYYALAPEKK